MAQPSELSSNKCQDTSSSWNILKWDNPENVNHSRINKKPRIINSCRKCGPSYKTNTNCFLCKKVTKIYPKLSVSTMSKEEKPSTTTRSTTAPHKEARLCKEHWWRCDGPCKDRLPFFGLVRRRIDRPPGPRDKWFVQHSVTCGGIFVKVKEPDSIKLKTNSKNGDIRNFFSVPSSNCSSASDSSIETSSGNNVKSEGSGLALSYDDVDSSTTSISESAENADFNYDSEMMKMCDELEEKLVNNSNQVSCVACGTQVAKDKLNLHLSDCVNDIFEVEIDGESEWDVKKDNLQFSCPFCMKLFSESDLTGHIDVCSSTSGSAIIQSLINNNF